MNPYVAVVLIAAGLVAAIGLPVWIHDRRTP
jgi:hypothetical protein